MYNLISVQVLESDDDINQKEFSLFFAEKLLVSEMVPQITAVEVVHQQIEIFSILESDFHINNEGMAQSGEEITLVHN
jgi:hypothetical protein